MTQKILFLGYGDIAYRTAQLLAACRWQCVGACRHPEHKPTLAGVELISADANNEADLRALLGQGFDTIIITLTPTSVDPDGYHQGYVVPCRHLQHLLYQLPNPPRVIYVSSTQVYGHRNGEWVDESSATEPSTASGAMLLQAEQVLQGSPTAVTILRCAGIYGPGRERLQTMIQGGKAVVTPAWTNHIHSADVAGFIAYLLQQPQHQGQVYIVSDNQPLLQEEAYRRIATQIGTSIDHLTRSDVIGPRGSKRLRNDKMRATGYCLKYPVRITA